MAESKPALWISHVTVSDAAGYAEYARRAGAAIAAHGGAFVARGGAHATLEGVERERHVVIRFPSMAAAEACYRSPAYQEALGFARDASERQLVIVETL
jgi:uncharacterized protein (DUF1330 family)